MCDTDNQLNSKEGVSLCTTCRLPVLQVCMWSHICLTARFDVVTHSKHCFVDLLRLRGLKTDVFYQTANANQPDRVGKAERQRRISSQGAVIVNKRIWFVVVLGEPEIKWWVDSESGCKLASTYSWHYIPIRTTTQTIYCWSPPAVVSAVTLWPLGSCLPQIKSISAIYFGINNSHFPPSIHPLSGREWKAISIRAMCSPGGWERKQEMQKRKWETERGRVFPFIITISGSFCSVVVTGSIASVTVPMSAMWSHDKLAVIHQSSELTQRCSQVSVPEERKITNEISLISWLFHTDWNASLS